MKNLNNLPLWHADPSHAETYNKYAEPQRETARHLIDFINIACPRKILEPGSGTGIYTQMLSDKFAESQITCVDLSSAAINIAKKDLKSDNITYIHGDVENMPLGNYDLITANAVFQWMRDLPLWMQKVYNSLNPGGTTAFTYFSNNTYHELSSVVNRVFGDGEEITSRQFYTVDELREMTTSFSASHLEIIDFTMKYDSLRDLLISIRATGTRGKKYNSPVWTKGKYKLIEDIYNDEFGGIIVTYNVILYSGVK